jgi:hypothetical protein
LTSAAQNEIGVATDPKLISQLKEIDNVRPLIDIPLWIHGACRRARSMETGERVKEVWNDLVDGFLKIDFVQDSASGCSANDRRDHAEDLFNTGTWRKIHLRTAYDVESQEFLSWNVMTFIAFYLNDEREDRRFEVWNGALG